MRVRSENDDDRAAIADLVRRTYTDIAWSDHREHLMIDRLRRSEAFVPMLSLVAEIDGQLVGHVLLTRASIGKSAAVTLALAPLSIVPERQNHGIGSMLVREAHIGTSIPPRSMPPCSRRVRPR